MHILPSNYFPPNRTCTFQRIRLSRSPCRMYSKDSILTTSSWTSCIPFPCLRHYPEHLSTMDTPSPYVSRHIGDPQVTHYLWSVCRFPLRLFLFSEEVLPKALLTLLIYINNVRNENYIVLIGECTSTATRVQAISLNHVRPSCLSFWTWYRTSTDFYTTCYCSLKPFG